MSTRVCESNDCKAEYQPVLKEQRFCSDRCSSRERQRRWQARRRRKPHVGGDGGGGDNGGGGLHASLGGAVEYLRDGSVTDQSRYSVKSPARKPVEKVPAQPTAQPTGETHVA